MDISRRGQESEKYGKPGPLLIYPAAAGYRAYIELYNVIKSYSPVSTQHLRVPPHEHQTPPYLSMQSYMYHVSGLENSRLEARCR